MIRPGQPDRDAPLGEWSFREWPVSVPVPSVHLTVFQAMARRSARRTESDAASVGGLFTDWASYSHLIGRHGHVILGRFSASSKDYRQAIAKATACTRSCR